MTRNRNRHVGLPSVQRQSIANVERAQEALRSKFHEHQFYAPYTTRDPAFMEREGEPCRHCLYPLLQHYNGRCPREAA